MKLNDLLDFCNLLMDFQGVERAILLPDESRHENDAEHSYSLAMMAWYIVHRGKLPLDSNKVIKYALAHDLVEVYAGDSYIYDPEMVADKADREHAALELLQRNFPDFEEMLDLVAAYEAREDDEARFVYALDKILPVLIIYLGKGKTWQKRAITPDMLANHKDEKVKLSPPVAELWEEIKQRLAAEPELFASTPAAASSQN